jgi:hypothetical protein
MLRIIRNRPKSEIVRVRARVVVRAAPLIGGQGLAMKPVSACISEPHIWYASRYDAMHNGAMRHCENRKVNRFDASHEAVALHAGTQAEFW